MVVQPLVNGRKVNGYIGVLRVQVLDAFRRADDAHELDALHPPAFENIHRGRGRAAGCQHGVEHQTQGNRGFHRQFVVIFHRSQGLLIAVKANVPHLRRGQQVPDAFHHAQPRAQNGHQPDLVVHRKALRGRKRGFHRFGARGQIRGGFIGQQRGNFPHQVAEGLGVGLLVAQQGKFVRNQRMR